MLKYNYFSVCLLLQLLSCSLHGFFFRLLMYLLSVFTEGSSSVLTVTLSPWWSSGFGKVVAYGPLTFTIDINQLLSVSSLLGDN